MVASSPTRPSRGTPSNDEDRRVHFVEPDIETRVEKKGLARECARLKSSLTQTLSPHRERALEGTDRQDK
jgi:hypothetical protein